MVVDCGETVTQRTAVQQGGSVTSPNYPEPYPNNANCTWSFRPLTG